MLIKPFPEIAQTQSLSVCYCWLATLRAQGKMVASFLYSYVKPCFRGLASVITSCSCLITDQHVWDRKTGSTSHGRPFPSRHQVRLADLFQKKYRPQKKPEALGELLHWRQVSSLISVLTAAPTYFLWFHICKTSFYHRTTSTNLTGSLGLLIIKSLQSRPCSAKGVLIRV